MKNRMYQGRSYLPNWNATLRDVIKEVVKIVLFVATMLFALTVWSLYF